MNFIKMQGAGNDFVLVEASGMKHDWPRLATAMCDRHFGIGSDGLLVLVPSDIADFRMRMFNPDGSESNACGNGLRCLAKYILHRGLVASETQEISVETMSGIRKARMHKVGGKVATIQVSMGAPQFDARDIPVFIEPSEGNRVDIKPILNYPVTIEGKELPMSFVSMGNPHAVCFWQYPLSDFPLSQLGPRVERHNIFPSRVNF